MKVGTDSDSTFNVLLIAVLVAAALMAFVWAVTKYASGSLQTVEVIQVDDRTRCVVVSRGVHISVDCISEKSVEED